MRVVLSLAAAVLLIAGTASADIVYGYTEDGIDFTLTLEQSGLNVNAELMMDTTSYVTAGSTQNYAHAISIKIFSSDETVSLLSAPVGLLTDWTTVTGGANNNTVPPANSTTAGSGFITTYYNATGATTSDSGLEVPDGTLTWEWSFLNTDLNDTIAASIKGVTIRYDDRTNKQEWTKAQQWSSGELTPDPPGGGDPIPEPGTFALLALGIAGLAAHRARRRKTA